MKKKPRLLSFVAQSHPEVILPTNDIGIETHGDYYYIFSSHAPNIQWRVSKEEYDRVREIIMEAKNEA